MESELNCFSFPSLSYFINVGLVLLFEHMTFALCIQALEDQVTEITPSALSFVDSGTPSEKLIYNVTKPLPSGQGLYTL